MQPNCRSFPQPLTVFVMTRDIYLKFELSKRVNHENQTFAPPIADLAL